MREWLTVIIVLLIIGILLDGFRRMRAHRRETVRLSNSMSDIDPLLDDQGTPSTEFPSGGARVIGYREDTDSMHQNVKESYAASRKTRGAPRRPSEQSPVELSTSPVGSEPEKDLAATTPVHADDEIDERLVLGPDDFVEPSIGNMDDMEGPERVSVTEPWSNLDEVSPSPYAGFQKNTSEHTPVKPAAVKPTVSKVAPPKSAPVVEKPAEVKEKPPLPAPDEVLVMNVMAPKGEVFVGEELLKSILSVGFRFGDMDIFHRHEDADGSGKVLFGMANMVKPGTFDLNSMSTFETPGVSMFLTLPIEGDSLNAYMLMANAAQAVAKELGGELKDENRSVMTRQTIEHGRQRVIEYERKRRLAKA